MKNASINLLLILFSTLFATLIAEQIYRIYLFGWDSFSVEKMNSIHNIGQSGYLREAPQVRQFDRGFLPVGPRAACYFGLFAARECSATRIFRGYIYAYRYIV